MKPVFTYVLTAAFICLSATAAFANHDGTQCHHKKSHCAWNKSYNDQTYHLTNTDVSRLQRSLHDKGYYNGPVDGLWGIKTTQAIQAYQTANDLEATGTLSTADLGNLGVRIDDSAYDGTETYKYRHKKYKYVKDGTYQPQDRGLEYDNRTHLNK